MASRSPVNSAFHVTVVLAQEKLGTARATSPNLRGFNLLGPQDAVLADIAPVLSAMLSKTMLAPVTVELVQEIDADAPDTQLLLYRADVERLLK
jgi:hypothetical protein